MVASGSGWHNPVGFCVKLEENNNSKKKLMMDAATRLCLCAFDNGT